MEPVQLYKHHQQVRYNKGKPGLDKNTELSLRVLFPTPSTFETKYVCTMIDRILVNCWRAKITVTVLKPWIQSLERSGHIPPVTKQIRIFFENAITIDDYIQIFAENYLWELHGYNVPTSMNSNLFSSASPSNLTRADTQVMSVINEYHMKGLWSRKRKRLQCSLMTCVCRTLDCIQVILYVINTRCFKMAQKKIEKNVFCVLVVAHQQGIQHMSALFVRYLYV